MNVLLLLLAGLGPVTELSPSAPAVPRPPTRAMAVAYGTGNWLVAWVDTTYSANPEVYMTRVLADDTVETPYGQVLFRQPDLTAVQSLTLAFNGSSWLVAWITFDGPVANIVGMRVAADGTPLDVAPRPLYVDPSGYSPISAVAAASDGAQFIVAWATLGDTKVGRVDALGNPLDGAGLTVAARDYPQVSGTLAGYDGTAFQIAWTERNTSAPYDSLMFQHAVSRAGMNVGAKVSLGPLDEGWSPFLLEVTDGTLTAWGSIDAGPQLPHVYVVDSDGGSRQASLLAAGPGPIGFGAGAALGPDAILGASAAGAWNLIAVHGDGGIGAMGTLSPPPGMSYGFGTASANRAPVALWCLGQSSMITSIGSTTCQRVGPPLQALDPMPPLLAISAPDQLLPAIVASPQQALAVWQENRADNLVNLLRPIGPDGTPTGVDIDGGLFSFGTLGPLTVQARLVRSGDVALFVWNERFSILAQRYSLDGGLLDAQPIDWPANPTFNDAWPFAVAFSDRFGVFWTETQTGVWLQELGFDGGLLGSSQLVVPLAHFPEPAGGAAGADLALIATYGLPGASRVTAAGTLLDATPIDIGDSQVWAGSAPSVASDGTDFLVVWTQTDGGPFDVRGRFVGADGGLGALLNLATGIGVLDDGTYESTQAVAWDGTRYFAAWQSVTDAGHCDIVGRFIERDGGGSVAAPVVSGPEMRRDIGIAPVSPGRLMLTWAELDETQRWGSNRVFTRLVLDEPLGGPCADGSYCSSTFCADGVCCDSACGGSAVDCLVCSPAGHCGTAPSMAVCRPSVGPCDAAEVCDGLATTCPADQPPACDGGVDAGIDGGADGGQGSGVDGGQDAGAQASADGGAVTDAGAAPGAQRLGVGCGCGTSGSPLLLIVGAMALLRRRRAAA